MAYRLNSYSEPSASGYLSGAIWERIAAESLATGAKRGIFKVWDFLGDADENEHRAADTATAGVLAIPGWLIDIVESGAGVTTVDLSDPAHGGVLEVDCDAGANDGAQMQYHAPLALSSCNRVAMEARLSVADADQAQHFLGVCNLDSSVIASGAHSGTDYVGVQAIGTDAVTLATRKASGTASSTSLTGGTLADATYIKLGWVYDRSRGTIDAYVNGEKAGYYDGSEIPTTVLVYPTLVAQCEDTGGDITLVDWIAFGAELS